MSIYLLNILSLPIYKIVIKKKKLFCIIISIQIFLILALRDIVLGADLPTYNGGFQYISSLSFLDMLRTLRFFRCAELIYPYAFESGYVILNWVVSKCGIDFHGLLIICAAINVVSVGRFIYKYSKKPLLGFSIFISFNMYFYCFSAIRQSLAMSIVLWSLPLLIDKKQIKALAIITIAFWFHRTAILWLPFLALIKIRIKPAYFVLFLSASVVLLFLAPTIYNIIISKLLLKVGLYHTTIHFQYNNMVMLLFLLCIIIFLFINFTVFEDQALNIAGWGLLIALAYSILGMCNEAFARGVTLCLIFLTVLIPNLIYTYHDRKVKIIGEIVVYTCMVVFLFYSLSTNAASIVPYKLYSKGW